jgi:hypothetical protein
MLPLCGDLSSPARGGKQGLSEVRAPAPTPSVGRSARTALAPWRGFRAHRGRPQGRAADFTKALRLESVCRKPGSPSPLPATSQETPPLLMLEPLRLASLPGSQPKRKENPSRFPSQAYDYAQATPAQILVTHSPRQSMRSPCFLMPTPNRSSTRRASSSGLIVQTSKLRAVVVSLLLSLTDHVPVTLD